MRRASRVQAVVNYFGPTDLTASDLPEPSRPILARFLGGAPTEKAELARQASPLTYVTADDPPILTFQGTKDPLVPATQAIRLAEAQTKAVAPGRVELLINAGHGWGGDDMKRTILESVQFLDHCLKHTGDQTK